jgi:hypothetical protein
VYGIQLRRFLAFDDEQQRLTALEQGVIDVEVTFTSDPRLADGSIVPLRDDSGLDIPRVRPHRTQDRPPVRGGRDGAALRRRGP